MTKDERIAIKLNDLRVQQRDLQALKARRDDGKRVPKIRTMGGRITEPAALESLLAFTEQRIGWLLWAKPRSVKLLMARIEELKTVLTQEEYENRDGDMREVRIEAYEVICEIVLLEQLTGLKRVI